MVRLIRAGVLAVLAAALAAHADVKQPDSSYDGALKAYEDGRFEAAYAEWRELAASGDPRAQVLLGIAMVEGKHVPRDPVAAYAWLDIATRNPRFGATVTREAEKMRNALVPVMSGAELIRAEQLVVDYERRMLDQVRQLRTRTVEAIQRSGSSGTGLLVRGCAASPGKYECAAARAASVTSGACDGPFEDADAPASWHGSLAQLSALEFPGPARRPGVAYSVAWVGEVDRSGFVCRIAVETSSGRIEIDKQVLNAVSRWRFQPATRGGVPVDSYVAGTLTFKGP